MPERPSGVAVRMFRDPAHQAAFERDGFLQVPFLDEPELRALDDLWARYGDDGVRGIYSNVHDRDRATNDVIDRTITSTFARAAEALFVDHRQAGASFLVKGAGPDSASTPHQDWANAEEDRALSLSIWCPLVDVDERNGALQVLPGTHRLRRTVRSLDTDSLYLDFDDDLEPHLVAVPCRRGEAVVYAHNLFHGSKPNTSDRARVACVSGVLPRWARSIHLRRSDTADPDEFDLLEVERDFYFSGIAAMKEGLLPDTARFVRRVRVPDHRLTADQVLTAVSAR
ncbi:MAG: phytanoyl-CoA dioxygenase family protein [Acidimicrobiales bacterium]|nr:phytanoyl-CoA dioxygenase family protein [Acidimicrobiales bacterium]